MMNNIFHIPPCPAIDRVHPQREMLLTLTSHAH
jgi:hypothetical protein